MTTATLVVPTTEELAAKCAADPELQLAARHWTGGLRMTIGDQVTGYTVTGGVISPGVPEPGPGVISISGPAETWAALFEATPAPFAQITVLATMMDGALSRDATDEVLWWQYAPAVERTSELLRAPGLVRDQLSEPGSVPRHDSPVGRYVHVELGGADHRIYYEQAGQGIPVLMQHTAGAHSLQYRHLFEMEEITEHFRLIAYDLPFHGKSIPPVGPRWWEQEYRLEGELLRQVPVRLAAALELEQPVFMGCSVGGLLALDLALHHPDVFRAVISLEGALNIDADLESLTGFWHPQVSNHSKARAMEALCAPMSPEGYVKEVSQVYAAGWPPAFIGDLWYYLVDYDIRDRAHEIDTRQVAVHILSGEYDWSGSPDLGRAAHEAIAGSTHAVMEGMGHFPMQENPERFAGYLRPVLEEIRGSRG